MQINYLKIVFSILAILLQGLSIYAHGDINNLVKSNAVIKFDDKPSTILSAEQAFQFVVAEITEDKIKIDVTIADNCYLYKNKLVVTANNNQVLHNIILPTSQIITDEFTAEKIFIFDRSFSFYLKNDQHNLKSLTIDYQGCAKDKLCYPPQTINLTISNLDSAKNIENNSNTNFSYFNFLTQNSFLVNILLFLLAGIALCFTPCIFPMLPIACSLIVNDSQASKMQSAILVIVYIIGMSVTMAVMGIITASLGAGANLQTYAQTPLILISVAIIFIVLAISMFGVYELAIPKFITEKLNITHSKWQSHKFMYAFLMGVIASIVVSPCVSAPLAGALLYISTTANLILGGCCLFALGLGMGIPIFIVAVSGKTFMPKSGQWLILVRNLFGIIMIAIALLLVSRILSAVAISALIGIAMSSCGYLMHIYTQPHFNNKAQVKFKKLCFSLVYIGLLLTINAPIYYLYNDFKTHEYSSQSTTERTENNIIVSEKVITTSSIDELQIKLAEFSLQKIPVIMLIQANWCVSCHKMEQDMLANEEIKNLMQDFAYVRLDITGNTEEQNNYLKKINIFGPPALLFFDKNGKELAELKLNYATSTDKISKNIKRTLK